jgi:hypothetical protein
MRRICITSIKVLISVAMLFVWTLYPNYKTFATGLLVEGGKIVNVTYCDCSGSVLDYNLDYATESEIPLMYEPGTTQLYANYNPYTVGAQTVSDYLVVPMECEVYSGEECDTQGESTGIWYLLGTTAY